MGTRSDPKDAILVPIAETLTADAITTAITGSTAILASSTSSPRAGLAVASQDGTQLVPRVHGRQWFDALFQCVGAGSPGRHRGVELAIRPTDDHSYADADYLGWAPPNYLAFWDSPYWASSAPADQWAACVHPNGRIILSAFISGSSSYYATPHADSVGWTDTTTEPSDDGEFGRAMVALPSGRVLLFSQKGNGDSFANYTDDEGANWATLAARIIPDGVAASLGQGQAAYLDGSILWVVRKTTTSADLYQLASTTDGTSFELVETASTMAKTLAYAAPSVVSTGTRLLVGFVRDADGFATVRILGSAYEPMSGATEVAINGVATEEVQLCAEEDGLIWAFVRISSDPSNVDLYVSYDEGSTWTQMDHGVFDWGGGSNDYIVRLLPIATAGYVCLLHEWIATTATEDGSIGAMWLGGWGNCVPDAEAFLHDTLQQRVGSGVDNTGGGVDGFGWLPMELPHNGPGWTHTASAGTVALTSPGNMRITTAAASDYFTIATGTSMSGVITTAMVEPVAGGSVSTSDIALRVQVANNVADYDVALRLDTSGNQVRLVDRNNGDATLHTESITWGADGVRIFQLEKGTLGTWWLRYRTIKTTSWTEAWTGSSTDGGGGTANGQVQFGNIASASATSEWQMVWQKEGMTILDDVDDVLHSRPLTARPVPVPLIGGTGAGGTTVARLSATSGPGRLLEEWTVKAASDYPWEAMLAGVAPSPDVGFRKSNRTAIALDFDLGEDTHLGQLAVVVLNSNILALTLQIDDAAESGWVTQGLSTPYITGSLGYAATGNAFRPGVATAESDRYIRPGELVGGFLYSNTSAVASRITHNTGGWWTENTEAVPEIIVEDGSGFSATGSCFLYPPSYILFPEMKDERGRYLRIGASSSLVTPGSENYRIGTILICRVRALGRDAAWGGGYGVEGNVSVRRSRYGTSRARQLGPLQKRWRLSFADPMDHNILRAAADIGYRGLSSGPVLVADEDSVHTLESVYRECKAGEVPVIAVSKLPSVVTAVTVTDSATWCYGRLLGPITATIPTGDLGTDEVVRLDPIEIDPIV